MSIFIIGNRNFPFNASRGNNTLTFGNTHGTDTGLMILYSFDGMVQHIIFEIPDFSGHVFRGADDIFTIGSEVSASH